MSHHTIHVTGLSFAYPDGQQAIQDVSLLVAPGEKVDRDEVSCSECATRYQVRSGVVSELAR